MEKEDSPRNIRLLPAPFGMYNTGANCYMNSLLQALISLGPFQRALLAKREMLEPHHLGRLLLELMENVHERKTAWDGSGSIVRALQLEVKKNHRTNFGDNQESASEAFVFLLEVLDNYCTRPEKKKPSEYFARLFETEYWRTQTCPRCGKYREKRIQNSFIDLFDMPKEIFTSQDEKKFREWIEIHRDDIEEYSCDSKKCSGAKVTLKCRLELEFLSPVVVFCFGAYREYQGTHDWWFPKELTIKAQCTMTYRAVAVVEHSGSLAGGHYWAKCMRIPEVGDAIPYRLNDTSTLELPVLEGSKDSYLVYYTKMET